MGDWENTIIPLQEAHEILSVFGIGPASREYQRWRRDDGFRHVDFEDVLSKSGAVLIVDGRECLEDIIDVVLRQLQEIDIKADADLGEDGDEGVLRVEGQSARLKFVPANDDDFDDVISMVNGLIKGKACYKKFRSCEGSDGWRYAVLLNSDWQELELSARESAALLFV